MFSLGTHDVAKGTLIIRAGEARLGLCRLDRGLARLTWPLGEGTTTAGHLVPGNYFGEECLMGEESRFSVEVVSASATYTLIDPATLSVEDTREVAINLARRSSKAALCHALTRRGPVKARVAALLLGLINTALACTSDDGNWVISNLTHELMAAAIAVEREQVTKALAELKGSGAITAGYRKVGLVDVLALYETAGGFGPADMSVLRNLIAASCESPQPLQGESPGTPPAAPPDAPR